MAYSHGKSKVLHFNRSNNVSSPLRSTRSPQELADLDGAWAQRARTREEKELQLIHSMEDKHQAELAEQRRRATLEPVRPKFSVEYLNLRKVEVSLAKLREYTRAHEVRVKADAMEAAELSEAAEQHMARHP